MDKLLNYAKSNVDLCVTHDSINKGLYAEYGVKKVLRDENG